MDVNQLDTVIQEYIATIKTSYAIMINGPWGIGKTHFIKQSLKDNYLYISLYGVKSTMEMDDRIFSQLIGIENTSDGAIEKAGKLISSVLKSVGESGASSIGTIASTVGSALKARAIENISKNTVLVFDDLERSSLPPHEVLSKLNELTEHKELKIIILCDETKISSTENQYWTNKEKTILFTNTLERSAKERAAICLADKLSNNDDLKRQSLKELERIIEIIDAKNLRILNLAVDCYEKIIKRIEESNHDLKGNPEKLIAIIFPCVGYALAQRQYKVSLDVLERCTEDYNEVLTSHVLTSHRNDREKEESERTAWDYFYEEVCSKDQSSLQFKSVFNYICHGLLDDEHILNDLKQLEPERLHASIIVMENHMDAGDECYASAISFVLEAMKNKTLDIGYAGDLIKLSNSLVYQFEMSAFEYKSLEELQDLINEFADHAIDNFDLNPIIDDPLFRRTRTNTDDFSKELGDRIVNATNRQIADSIKSEYQKNIVDAIRSDDQRGVYSFKNSTMHDPCITKAFISDIVNSLKDAQPDGVLGFAKFLNDRYRTSNIFVFLSDEISPLKALSKEINVYISTRKPSATTYCFSVLQNTLAELVLRGDKHISAENDRKKAEANDE